MSNFYVEFDEWVNHPMTKKVMDYLVEQRNKLNSVDESYALKVAVYQSDPIDVHALGLHSLKCASVVAGIDMFVETENLRAEMREA